MTELIIGYVLKGVGILLGLLLTYLISLATKKFNLRSAEKEALDALRDGIQISYETIVKEAKVKGKLTQEVRDRAKSAAISEAKRIAKGSGKKLLETIAKERLSTWVEDILKKVKK